MLCSQLLSTGHFLYFDLSGNNVAVNPEQWSQFENLLVANWARGLVSSREILWQPCVLNLVIIDNGNWTVNVFLGVNPMFKQSFQVLGFVKENEYDFFLAGPQLTSDMCRRPGPRHLVWGHAHQFYTVPFPAPLKGPCAAVSNRNACLSRIRDWT